MLATRDFGFGEDTFDNTGAGRSSDSAFFFVAALAKPHDAGNGKEVKNLPPMG